MVGRLEDQKNYFFAIDLLEDSGLTLDVYGVGSLENEIINYAQQKKVSVQINGVINNKELREIYSKYKIYLSTSKFEGNSKTILEAMNAGCVVFASKIDNNLELFDNNGILFKLESQNKKEVLGKVFSYLNNDSNQPQLSSNAVEYTKKNHLLKKYIDSLLNDLIFMK
jgi:glycosyltransferase involved in cell wall biosynthesis